MKHELKLWLRAANPFAPPRGMAEAQRSARAGAVALAVSAVQSAASLPMMSDKLAQSMTEVTQAQGGSAADQAMMEGVMTVLAPTMIAMMAAFSILYLVLAVVQWRKATWVIPAIMLALLGYSLLSLVGGFLTMGSVMSELQSPFSVVLWLVQLAMGLVYVAAFRGGRMLDQLKRSV